jgi:hypothetical protein
LASLIPAVEQQAPGTRIRRGQIGGRDDRSSHNLSGSDRDARPGQRRRDRGPGTGDGAGDQSQQQPGLTKPPQRRDRPSNGFHDTIRTAAEAKPQGQGAQAAQRQEASRAPGVAPDRPRRWRRRPARAGSRAMVRSDSRSEWPPMNLVALCTTMSAPRARGCCSSGVAKVLSIPARAPAWQPAAHRAGRSATSSSGLEGAPARAGPRRRRRPGRLRCRSGPRGRRSSGRAGGVGEKPADPEVAVLGGDDAAAGRQEVEHGGDRGLPEENATAWPPSTWPTAVPNASLPGVASVRE